MVERTCPTCGGAGQVIEDPCDACHGTGRKRKERKLEVQVPAGVEDGTRIRLAGEGEAGARGAPPGDLYVFLNIKPHPLFQRDGKTIYCRLPIPMTKAALGGELTLPTIDGSEAVLEIPQGTQTGRVFRLKGKGMSVYRSAERGDMQVEAYVEVPVKLSKKQKELLEEFAAEAGDAHSPESSSFWNRVRDVWKTGS